MFTKITENYYGIEHLINVNKVCEIEKCGNTYSGYGGSTFSFIVYFENRNIKFSFQSREERDKAFEKLEKMVMGERELCHKNN